MSDHFNPGNRTINLSESIYSGTSVASMAVAAHECGHAIQHHEGYAPIRVRNAILPFCNVGNYLGWIAVMIGADFWLHKGCLDWFILIWHSGFSGYYTSC